VKHGPNTPYNYFSIHEDTLLRYTTDYSPEERFYELDYNEAGTRVKLHCRNIILTTHAGNQVRCDIVKVAEKNNNTQKIKTIKYSYSVSRFKEKSSELFRYCSSDEDKLIYDPNNHHTYHHKHDFLSGNEIIVKIEDDEYPHVSEFFDEVLNLPKF
jgi:hypothetical protein